MVKKLYLMSGLPGCGKSTFLEGLPYPPGIIISPDEFRLVLTGQDYYAPAEDSVWSHVKTATRVLLKKYNVVIDATHLTIGSRAQWIKIAKSMGIPICCYYVTTPLNVCLSRNSQRIRKVPEEVIKKMHETMEPPDILEGFEWIECIIMDELDSNI